MDLVVVRGGDNLNYKIELSNFEGPLDLLLHLVKETKMDIYEVNISEIIEKYLEYINSLKDLNIDVASEYLVMAADLIHIKSRKLINTDFDEVSDEETFITSEEDLKNKLIEYEKYKNMSETFKELEENRQGFYTKAPENLKEYKNEEFHLSGDITLQDLVDAFLAFKEREKFLKPVSTKITRKELSVSERKNYIRSIIKHKGKVNFVDLFETFQKDYVIVTFLSILDMVKSNEISIVQEDNFGNIVIEGR